MNLLHRWLGWTWAEAPAIRYAVLHHCPALLLLSPLLFCRRFGLRQLLSTITGHQDLLKVKSKKKNCQQPTAKEKKIYGEKPKEHLYSGIAYNIYGSPYLTWAKSMEPRGSGCDIQVPRRISTTASSLLLSSRSHYSHCWSQEPTFIELGSTLKMPSSHVPSHQQQHEGGMPPRIDPGIDRPTHMRQPGKLTSMVVIMLTSRAAG